MINVLYTILQNHTLDDIPKKYNIKVIHHPTEKIALLNVCNGLVLEIFPPYRIVSRGFDHFSNVQDADKIHIRRAIIKENGIQFFLFKYNDKFILNTNNNFIEKDSDLYRLFLKIIDTSIYDFALGLFYQLTKHDDVIETLSDIPYMDYILQSLNITNTQKSLTICFEMCSEYNRIVKLYTEPTLFLLAVFRENEELNTDKLVLPYHVKHSTQIDSMKNKTMAIHDVADFFKNYTTVEGIVLETMDNLRVFVKNPVYAVQHTLKYKGWTQCTPKLIVPYILNKFAKNLVYDTPMDSITEYEVKERIELYVFTIKKEFDTVVLVLRQLSKIKFKTPLDYLTVLTNEYSNIFDKWSSLFIDMFEHINGLDKINMQTFDNIFKKHLLDNIDTIFPYNDPLIDRIHSKKCCKMDNIPKNLEDYKNDGMALNSSMCYCGCTMKIVKLTIDLSRYKICFCGSSYGTITYKRGTYLAVCTNTSCLCTQDVDQQTRIIIGIPACMYLKSLRMAVSEHTGESTNVENLGLYECCRILTA